MLRTMHYVCVVLLLLLCHAPPAAGLIYTWSGAAATTDWFNANNWDGPPDVPDSAADIVVIRDLGVEAGPYPILRESITIGELRIIDSGARVTIAPRRDGSPTRVTIGHGDSLTIAPGAALVIQRNATVCLRGGSVRLGGRIVFEAAPTDSNTPARLEFARDMHILPHDAPSRTEQRIVGRDEQAPAVIADRPAPAPPGPVEYMGGVPDMPTDPPAVLTLGAGITVTGHVAIRAELVNHGTIEPPAVIDRSED